MRRTIGAAVEEVTVARSLRIIIGGFEINNIAKLDWGNLEEAATELHQGSARERYQLAGTTGRAAQEALTMPVRDWQQYGPVEWLKWLHDTRKGTTHHAAGRRIVVPTADKRFVRLLYR